MQEGLRWCSPYVNTSSCWKQGEGRFIGPHYVFPLLLSPVFVVLAPLGTPLHIYCCDSGRPFYRTTCIPRHLQLNFLLLREEEGPHDTLKTKKDRQLHHVLYSGRPNLHVLYDVCFHYFVYPLYWYRKII
ncbi:hypothetical protein C0J52_19280 [Blattella germanica]|nr:hypothetical protein C0J52_19280 [Blattella germanica]